MDTNLARAADLLKVVTERVVDTADKLVEPRFPPTPELLDLCPQVPKLVLAAALLSSETLDVRGALLELVQRVWVARLDDVKPGGLGMDVAVDIRYGLILPEFYHS